MNPYTRMFESNLAAGHTVTDAAERVAHTYLDGKPGLQGKRKLTRTVLDAVFWSSEFLPALPDEAWQAEPLVLALARYMSQERISNLALLEHIASIAPETVRRAIRYSGLVLNQRSPKRGEIDSLAALAPAEFGELVRLLEGLDSAYGERLAAVETLHRPLAALSPLEFLAYVSLYAFEHLVPEQLMPANQTANPDADMQGAWEAINDLLVGKLRSATDGAFRLTERDIAKSLATHLSPFLFPSLDGPLPREDLYHALQALLAAQMELNSFIARSADAFAYDDSIEFALTDGQLTIVERDPTVRAAWARNGEKLNRLHTYWLYRAVDTFAASNNAATLFGKAEHHEANRFAYIKATRTQLQLTEVYGLSESVTTESGLTVDLFQALLSLELMCVFFQIDFLQPYRQYLEETGSARMALGVLASDGLDQTAPQIRFPLTWSDREEKISKITGWTVNQDSPLGSRRAAEAILDFWTSDWTSLSKRLRKQETGLEPALFERPIIKMGRHLFQLPWVVGVQNNSTAAINNLRRIGSRRAEAGAETQRIEARLAAMFEERGFNVQLNYEPERTEDHNPGEVDLICARDGKILVLEIKSTFLRHTQKDAWLHRTNTLRKAGLQIARKTQAIQRALATGSDLMDALGIKPREMTGFVQGWIVDTSIEHDHERFNGFLKVSLEEVLIALRDDSHLLNDPAGFLTGTTVEEFSEETESGRHSMLYPNGFSFSSFVDVIESEAIWRL